MNKKQCLILVIGALLISIMLIIPPFHFKAEGGIELNMGYGFLFDPPEFSGDMKSTVDTNMLVTQWLGVVLVGAALWLAACKK